MWYTIAGSTDLTRSTKLLLNKKAVRQFILDKISERRPHLKIDRVYKDVYNNLDAKIRRIILAEIDRHPTVGKTFRIEPLL
jgi:hypothetical protein